jgi:activating signal cointegrator complex subunit 3
MMMNEFSKYDGSGRMDDRFFLDLFGRSSEFEQLKVRDEEIEELSLLMNDEDICWYKPYGGSASVPGKVCILLQSYLARYYRYNNTALVSDVNYITQNAARLFRAMFEMMMTRTVGALDAVEKVLEWAKMIEWRISPVTAAYNKRSYYGGPHLLRHFVNNPPDSKYGGGGGSGGDDGVGKDNGSSSSGLTLSAQFVRKLEHAGWDFWSMLNDDGSPAVTVDELMGVCNCNKGGARDVLSYLHRVPFLVFSCSVHTITPSVIRVDLSVYLSSWFQWSDRWCSSGSELFHVWIEDPTNRDVLHHEMFGFTKKTRYETVVLEMVVPLVDPRPPQYILTITSDRWVGLSFSHGFSIRHLFLPDEIQEHTDLLELTPLPIANVVKDHRVVQALYGNRITHFNAIQTQVYHVLRHTNYNVLVGAPTGSGKTLIAEFAVMRALGIGGDDRPSMSSSDSKVVYIAPLKALSNERLKDWRKRFGKGGLGYEVLELTGDFTPDVAALMRAHIVITTPEKWDGISRHWQHRKYVTRVSLVIIDEIHLLGQDRGPVLEAIVSRMRYISSQVTNTATGGDGDQKQLQVQPIRFVGLSTALANARDIADWLGIGVIGLYNFRHSIRPVPMEIHIQGYPEKHYCPRMATMNKPCLAAIKSHGGHKPVLIFVSSRRQTRLTALDLIAFLSQDEEIRGQIEAGLSPWLDSTKTSAEEMMMLVGSGSIQDSTLKETLPFGVGVHHAGLHESDRQIVEQLFLDGKIQVLVATSTLAWGVNYPAHLVIVKGTEYFDGKLKKYVDMPITDVLQMIGRAGRPQFDDSAVAVVMVHEPKRPFYRKFLHHPFPVESSLHFKFTEHLNAEVNFFYFLGFFLRFVLVVSVVFLMQLIM